MKIAVRAYLGSRIKLGHSCLLNQQEWFWNGADKYTMGYPPDVADQEWEVAAVHQTQKARTGQPRKVDVR